MIKSLSNITEISVIDQNGSNDILTFSKIEFDDNPLGSGAFGSVHTVQSIDGISKPEFVLKILTKEKQHAYDVIKLLHQKLKKRQSKSKTPPFHDTPELLGLPFLVFKGYDIIEEQECVAFLMYNLEKLSYEDFGSDVSLSDDYKNLSIPNKLFLAYQLSKTIDILHNIEFIHSDISENSIWFNSKRIQLAIIDYDGGYHFDSQDKPSTLGKLWQGTTGFFKKVITGEIETEKVTSNDRLFEEYFWLAHHVFEIISGVSPYFFLSDADDNTKSKYLENFDWPNIDHSSHLFNIANSQQHHAIISFIEQLENAGASELISAFKTVFNKGYKNETKRLTSKEWRNLLSDLNQEMESNPLINNYSSNKTSINQKGEEVVFSFEVKKYNAIYLNDKLVPLSHNSISQTLEDSSKIVLRTINDFEVVEEVIQIEANKVAPQFNELQIGKDIRDTEEPVLINWKVENAKEVIFSNDQNKLPVKFFMNVKPTEKTTYKIKAIGYFDQVVEKEVTIDVIKPQINFFDWEVNLNEGLDNVDLSWETENAGKVTITPSLGEVKLSGKKHIGLDGKTEFTLQAKGIFGKLVEKSLKAQPFPLPVVKQIFAEAPEISISTKFEINENIIPKDILKVGEINISNNINFNNINIDSERLKSSINIPDFQTSNLLEKNINIEKTTLSDLYNSLLKKVYKKLNK